MKKKKNCVLCEKIRQKFWRIKIKPYLCIVIIKSQPCRAGPRSQILINMLHSLSFATLSAFAAAHPSGFTVNAFTGEIPTSGYCVALEATQNSHDDEGLARVIGLIESGTTRAEYVGGWLDTDTGLYYYDATVVVPTLAEALELGRVNGQIAIFHLDAMEEIRL